MHDDITDSFNIADILHFRIYSAHTRTHIAKSSNDIVGVGTVQIFNMYNIEWEYIKSQTDFHGTKPMRIKPNPCDGNIKFTEHLMK